MKCQRDVKGRHKALCAGSVQSSATVRIRSGLRTENSGSSLTRLTLSSRLSRAFRIIQMATSPKTRPRSTLPSTAPTSAPSGTDTTDLVELEPAATDSEADDEDDEDHEDDEEE